MTLKLEHVFWKMGSVAYCVERGVRFRELMLEALVFTYLLTKCYSVYKNQKFHRFAMCNVPVVFDWLKVFISKDRIYIYKTDDASKVRAVINAAI